jgi:hypothetical protein
MSRFLEIMNNYPEQVKKIQAYDSTKLTLFNGEVLDEGNDVYFGTGNVVFPNLEYYHEKFEGCDHTTTADLSKSKNLKNVIIINCPSIIKSNLVEVLKNAKVFLSDVDKTNAYRIRKLFPNSDISYNEDEEMEINPSVKKPSIKKPSIKNPSVKNPSVKKPSPH